MRGLTERDKGGTRVGCAVAAAGRGRYAVQRGRAAVADVGRSRRRMVAKVEYLLGMHTQRIECTRHRAYVE